MDLVVDAFRPLLATASAQLVVLGTGDAAVEDALTALERQHPRSVKVWLEFNAPLGQQVYAGCDVFLMPSRYEPCGLGQLISLRYGAVPLVRRTGGLADTVEDAGAAIRTGTGFVFDAADAASLRMTAERALRAYEDRQAWRAMQRRGMAQDWSWSRAAGAYAALYDRALAAASAPRREAKR
jgi:starch synthase